MNSNSNLYFSDPIYETHYDILCEEQQRLQKQYDAAKEQQELVQSDYQKLSQSAKKLATLGNEFVNQPELDSKLSVLSTKLTIKKAIVDGLSQQLNIIDQRKQENRDKQYDAGITRLQKEIFTENELQYYDMTMEH